MATENKRMLVRRDTAANWESNNPVLGPGEIGFETDTGFMKIGDGSTAWNLLAYYQNSLGFAARPSSDNAYTAGAFLEITFDTVDHDPHSGFAANAFTVPAVYNGLWGKISLGVTGSADQRVLIYILQTPSGESQTTIATGDSVRRPYVSKRVLLQTGDVYSAATFLISSNNTFDADATHFSLTI